MSYTDDPDFQKWNSLTPKARKKLIDSQGLKGNLRIDVGGFDAGISGNFEPDPEALSKVS